MKIPCLQLRECLLSFSADVLSSSLLYKHIKIKIHKYIFPAVLYGCETWSLTLWEERRLRMFENRVLRRIFGPKRDEVIREWRKLPNEEFYGLFSLPCIISGQIAHDEGGWARGTGGRAESAQVVLRTGRSGDTQPLIQRGYFFRGKATGARN